MKDQSQPPPRAECDACAKPFIDGTRYHLELSSFPDLCDTGADICKACNVGPSYLEVVELIRARRRSLQSAQKWSVGDRAWHTYAGDWCTLVERGGSPTAWFASFDREPGRRDVHILEEFLTRSAPDTIPLQPTPPAKHEFRVGDEVEWDEGENKHSENVRFNGLGRGVIKARYATGFIVDCAFGSRWGVEPASIIRPAASAQPESHKFEVGGDYTAIGLSGCQRRGKFIRIDDSGNARLDDNGREWAVQTDTLRLVTTSAKTSESKPSPQPRRDPYAEHNAELARKYGVTAADVDRYVCTTMMVKDNSTAMTRAERLRAQHLADLDRPIRTGPLLNRCRYGSLLSNHGWDSSDVDDELGCS